MNRPAILSLALAVLLPSLALAQEKSLGPGRYLVRTCEPPTEAKCRELFPPAPLVPPTEEECRELYPPPAPPAPPAPVSVQPRPELVLSPERPLDCDARLVLAPPPPHPKRSEKALRWLALGLVVRHATLALRGGEERVLVAAGLPTDDGGGHGHGPCRHHDCHD